MGVARKSGTQKAVGKNGAAKPAAKGRKQSKRAGRWVVDPFTGQKFWFIPPRPLPGGKIPLKDIRAAVRKVLAEELAREQAAAATPAG